MDRQTLRDWVLRFNERGPDGLINVKAPGRPPTLSKEQMEELGRLVEAVSEAEKDGVARWRCVDLKRVLGARFAVDLSEVSLGRVLRKLGFSHSSAGPRHPKQDPEAIATFKKSFPARVLETVSRLALATSIEVWFQDEMRVGQKNSLVYQWAKKGHRRRHHHAVCQHGGDAQTPRRDQPCRRARRTRHGHSRPSWLAHHAQTQSAEKPHHGVTAAGLSGTQRGGEHLAISAPDLSLQPGVQELHRHSRCLSGGLPKAPRRARPTRLLPNPRLGHLRSIQLN